MADAVNYQYYPGRISVENLTVYNGVEKTDVTGLMVEILVDTSIQSSSALVQIQLIDAVNFLTKYNLSHGNLITFDIVYKDVAFNYSVRVSSISNINQQNGQRLYVINCVSHLAYQSNYKKIQGVYTGSTASIAKSIFLENTDEKINLWEESIGNQKLIIPRMSPINTIKWLAYRSEWKDDFVRFKFFQDSRLNYNFTPIEKALQLYKNKPTMKYTHNLIAGNNSMGVPNTMEVNRAIKSIMYNDSYDIRNKVNNLRGKNISIDLVDKNYIIEDFDYFDNFTKERYLNSFPQYAKNDFSDGFINYDIDMSYTQPNVDKINKNSDISDFRTTNLDDSQNIEIEVVGNQSIDVMQVVEIEIASPEPKVQKHEGRNVIDKRWSGLYYVVAKKDIFNRNEHKMILGLAKESQVEEVLV